MSCVVSRTRRRSLLMTAGGLRAAGVVYVVTGSLGRVIIGLVGSSPGRHYG